MTDLNICIWLYIGMVFMQYMVKFLFSFVRVSFVNSSIELFGHHITWHLIALLGRVLVHLSGTFVYHVHIHRKLTFKIQFQLNYPFCNCAKAKMSFVQYLLVWQIITTIINLIWLITIDTCIQKYVTFKLLCIFT